MIISDVLTYIFRAIVGELPRLIHHHLVVAHNDVVQLALALDLSLFYVALRCNSRQVLFHVLSLVRDRVLV